jgi:hypothetical protein
LFTPTAAVFIEVVQGRSLREFELAADATAYKKAGSCGSEKSMSTNGNGAKVKHFSWASI